MTLTERDRRIISWVYQMRFLTREQVQRLEFSATTESFAKRRLMLLYQHGYLDRRPLLMDTAFGSSKPLYCLDSKGADWLAYAWKMERSELAWKPRDTQVSDYFMRHLLDTNDFRITLTLAAQEKGWPLEWIDEATLKSTEMKDYVTDPGQAGEVAVIPDGYFSLHDVPVQGARTRASFALELDRGNMEPRPWKRKVRAYITWWTTGQYQARYQTQSLRVLTVVSAARRARDQAHETELIEAHVEKLLSWTEEAGGKRMFWFTAAHMAEQQTVFDKPIWKVATLPGRHSLIGPSSP
jgi:hypothetical protein